METSLVTNSKGTILGGAKAFLIAHPIGMATVAGALLGIGSYYAIKKYRSKKDTTAETANITEAASA